MPQHTRTHGQYGTPLYWAWVHMKARCNEPQHYPGYVDVSYDARWETFEGFRDNPPRGDFAPGLSLARYNDRGNYTPDNCRWLTVAENSRESIERTMVRLPDGRFASDVAAEHGIHTCTWHARVKRGWPIERAVSATPRNQGRNRAPRTARQWGFERVSS